MGDVDTGFDLEAEARELGLDDALGRHVLAGLRHDPPPRFAEAQSQAAALAARWDASEPPVPALTAAKAPSPKAAPAGAAAAAAAASGGALRRGSRGSRVRSYSQGPFGTPGAAPSRPPLLGVSRASSPGPGQPIALVQLPSLPNPPHEQQPPARGEGSSGQNMGSINDSSLMTKMAGRLAQVERLNQQLSAKLSEQTREADALRKELEALKKACSQAADGTVEAGTSSVETVLRAERDELHQQVEDMKKFLNDYGLTWVPRSAKDAAAVASGALGPPCAGPSAGACAGRGDSVAERLGRPQQNAQLPRTAEGGSVSVDIQVIRSRVESLNVMVEEEDKTRGSVHHEQVPITFFCDGVKLGERAFIPYNLRPCQELIKELLDGYFPRALRDDHPHGVQLHVVDRTGNGFAAWLRDFAKNDPELADGGERLRPRCGHAVHAPGDAKSAGERLLSKLPERVVSKNGQICEVRGAIAEKLGLPSCGGPTAGGGAPAASEDVVLLDAGRDPSAPSVRLQVKLEGGQRLKLCMEPHATVGDLWNALEAWRKSHRVPRAGADGRPCTLRTAFPPRSYTDKSQTLEAAGLTPSATLFISCDEAGSGS